MARTWNKGRGKLGFLKPLLGSWVAKAESPMGPVRCRRSFAELLGGAYIQLEAVWDIGGKKDAYREVALIGTGGGKEVRYWSFTSDGKHAHGRVADVAALHPEAIGFELEMPAGLARMAYWPDGGDGFVWVVESRGKKGWNRFTEHHYTRVTD